MLMPSMTATKLSMARAELVGSKASSSVVTRLMGRGLCQPFFACQRLLKPVALGSQSRAQKPANLRIVFNHQHQGLHTGATQDSKTRGNRTRTAAPPPILLDASILPPCACAMAWQIANPRPAPLALVR